jgi:hypothetical protein
VQLSEIAAVGGRDGDKVGRAEVLQEVGVGRRGLLGPEVAVESQEDAGVSRMVDLPLVGRAEIGRTSVLCVGRRRAAARTNQSRSITDERQS